MTSAPLSDSRSQSLADIPLKRSEIAIYAFPALGFGRAPLLRFASEYATCDVDRVPIRRRRLEWIGNTSWVCAMSDNKDSVE